MRKLFVVYKNPDTVTAYFHFHFVPLSRHGVKAQRTDSHEFVCISGTHQVEIVLQPAFDTYHITVKAVMCTEACPYLYLFGVFRGTCLERQGIIFPLRIAEEGISAARMKYSIVHPTDTTSHSSGWEALEKSLLHTVWSWACVVRPDRLQAQAKNTLLIWFMIWFCSLKVHCI